MTYRVVVGVNGTPQSDAALAWAVVQARQFEGEVVACLAWQLPFVDMPGAFDQDELEAKATAFLRDTVERVVPDPPVPVHAVVAEGDARAVLIETGSHGADLLVLGSRGRRYFPGLPVGGVAQACVAGSHCPVVIVKVNAPGPDAAGGTDADGVTDDEDEPGLT